MREVHANTEPQQPRVGLFGNLGLVLLGFCATQIWVASIKQGGSSSDSLVSIAFHLGTLLGCLPALIVFGLRPKLHLAHWLDWVAAVLMCLTPIAMALAMDTTQAYPVVILLSGIGFGLCMLRWFDVLCSFSIKRAFLCILVAFTVAPAIKLLFLFVPEDFELIVSFVLFLMPWVSAGVSDKLYDRNAVDNRNTLAEKKSVRTAQQAQLTPEAARKRRTILIVECAICIFVFGGGVTSDILHGSIPSSYGGVLDIANYALRALLSLLLLAWIELHDRPFASLIAGVVLMIAVIVAISMSFVMDDGSAVMYLVNSAGRNFLIIFLLLMFVRIAAVSKCSHLFVFALGRSCYEAFIILSSLLYEYGPLQSIGSLGEQDTLIISTILVLVFIIFCFFTMVRDLGERSLPSDETDFEPIHVEPSLATDFYSHYGLTEREAEVATLFFNGFNKREIAERICVSENTVRFHIKQVYNKMDVHSRSEFMDALNKEEENTDR